MCALYTAVHVGGPVQSRWCWVVGSSQHLLPLPRSLCGAVLGGLLWAVSGLGVGIGYVGVSEAHAHYTILIRVYHVFTIIIKY